MRPQDIDKIASAVMVSLAGAPGAGLLGCYAWSSADYFDCHWGNYACGGLFDCGGEESFVCQHGFDCIDKIRCPSEFFLDCYSVPHTCRQSNFWCSNFDCLEYACHGTGGGFYCTAVYTSY